MLDDNDTHRLLLRSARLLCAGACARGHDGDRNEERGAGRLAQPPAPSIRRGCVFTGDVPVIPRFDSLYRTSTTGSFAAIVMAAWSSPSSIVAVMRMLNTYEPGAACVPPSVC